MTELALPKIDKDTISRKDQIVSHLKKFTKDENILSENEEIKPCLLYTSPSPRDLSTSRMPSSA